MKTMTSRYCSRIVTFVSILLAVVLVTTGCTPKAVPIEGPDVSALMLTNVTTSAYDAVPLTWSVGQNTLQSTGTTVLHANNTDGEAKLCWLAPTPATTIDVVQQWGIKDKLPLMTTKSQNDLDIYTPPVGMQYQPAMGVLLTQPFVRWFAEDAREGEIFLTTQLDILMSSSQSTLDGTSLTVTEKSIWQTAVPAPKTLTLTVPVPAGLTKLVVEYGSGSLTKGFVLVSASAQGKAGKGEANSIWLLRMSGTKGTWVQCDNTLGGIIVSDQGSSFARVGALLYFTCTGMKIGCIDTAAGAPSVTLPRTINTLYAKLHREQPTYDTPYNVQAQLTSGNGTLIIEYPDTNWNSLYYAVDAAGTVLGSLSVDKTSVTSFDANGKQGSSLKTPGSPGYISLPSIDLFQADIF